MGMIGYAIAAALGYYAGQPEGRRQLATLRRQAADVTRRPEVRRLRERGWDMVGDGALATRNLAGKVRSRTKGPDGDHDVDTATTTRGRRIPVLRGRSWRRPRPGSTTADPAGATSGGTDGPAGSGGTTVTEDRASESPGMSAPPLAGGSRPPASPED
jgi:hypothetical protein